MSKAFQKWLKDRDIQHELTSTYSPESNGKVERLNRTLLDMSRTLMLELSDVPKHERFWAEAVNTANFLRKRMFTSATNDKNKTPYEVIMGKKPNLGHIRKIGSKAIVHVPKAKRKGKFDARAKIGVLVGYERGNSYKFIPSKNKIITSRDVTFHEKLSQYKSGHVEPEKRSEESNVPIDVPQATDSTTETDEHSVDEIPDLLPNEEEDDDEYNDALTYSPNIRRSKRVSKPPVRFRNTGIIALNVRLGNEDADVPTTYKEALQGRDSKSWQKAMQEEIEEINKQGTWELVPLPNGAKAVKSKWVYTTKKDAEEKFIRNKSRLVAKGFTQRSGIDYNEVFAPVAKYSTLRFLLPLAADEELALLQLDVKSAFLTV